jgi:large subunit ribosomal protein L2
MSQIKLYKPTTASRRKTSVVDYRKILTTSTPHKKLTVRKTNTAGRNNTGKITIRHRGGGYKSMIRVIDFKRNFEQGVKILTVEYDPTRTAFINLVTDLKTGKKAYILHTKGVQVGDILTSNGDIKEGNKVTLISIPVGSMVSQIEQRPNSGSKLVRSAGNYALVTARDEKYVTLKLPSGEIKKFEGSCCCVVSRVGNESHELVRVGKAGRNRKKGIRPTVRGKVMNPVDHPHGGGEARNSIGMPYPKTPWGKHALGVKTRNKKSKSNKFIVSRRKKS